MPKLIPVNTLPRPETGAPPPDRVLSGHPHNRTWNSYASEDGCFFAGIWEAEPGAWEISYTEAEFCHILEGESRITDAAGVVTTVHAGDAFIIPPGFNGIWEVITHTRKHYAIYEAPTETMSNPA
jgi:uncharacterized cupin superfamily protein